MSVADDLMEAAIAHADRARHARRWRFQRRYHDFVKCSVCGNSSGILALLTWQCTWPGCDGIFLAAKYTPPTEAR